MLPYQSSLKLSFSGHETFPFRYTWLTKGIRGLLKYGNDLFTADDSIVKLGVGKNMVTSIRYWCETLGLVQRVNHTGLAVTELGDRLLGAEGWDPYLEDPGTLWLLHWRLVSRRERASTWYLAFTTWHTASFTREQLFEWLYKKVQTLQSTSTTPASLKRDVEVFVRTYTPATGRRDMPIEDSFDCPLVELGLVRDIEGGRLQFVRSNKKTLPDAIFLYALVDHWQRTAPNQQTLSFEAIMHGEGSVGGAFKLTDNALADRLERLPRNSGLVYTDTAGIRQLQATRDITEVELISILADYYKAKCEVAA